MSHSNKCHAIGSHSLCVQYLNAYLLKWPAQTPLLFAVIGFGFAFAHHWYKTRSHKRTHAPFQTNPIYFGLFNMCIRDTLSFNHPIISSSFRTDLNAKTHQQIFGRILWFDIWRRKNVIQTHHPYQIKWLLWSRRRCCDAI